MVAGFMFSRVALSISTFLFGINAIRDVHPREWLKQKWWLLGLCWIAFYALSWFWTSDKGNWGTRLEVKLPFLILPLAFGFLPKFTAKQLQVITIGAGFCFLASALYSLSFLITDPGASIFKYDFADVLPTLPKKDHVRAGLSVSLFIVWGFYVFPYLERRIQWFIGCLLVFLIVFIHVLAVKSGLLSFYIFLIGMSIYLAFSKKKLLGIIVVIAIPVLVFLAINYIPTFSKRANYIYFSWWMYNHGDASGNYGDINRLKSYEIAFDLIGEHPLTGVGTGDMLKQMTTGFHKWNPNLPEQAIILPHNQFLTIALGCGLPAMFLFLLWFFIPLLQLKKGRSGFYFFIMWLLALIQLMIEPVLEVQFGVFVFLFFLLMQQHQMNTGTKIIALPTKA